jgi:hypothetical protein
VGPLKLALPGYAFKSMLQHMQVCDSGFKLGLQRKHVHGSHAYVCVHPMDRGRAQSSQYIATSAENPEISTTTKSGTHATESGTHATPNKTCTRWECTHDESGRVRSPAYSAKLKMCVFIYTRTIESHT